MDSVGRTQALKMPAGLEEGNLKCDKGVKKKMLSKNGMSENIVFFKFM